MSDELRRVWKYPVELRDGPWSFTMPESAKVVHFASFGGLQLWAEGYPEQAKAERWFQIVGTGHPVPANGIHRGTVIESRLVWHLYELEQESA